MNITGKNELGNRIMFNEKILYETYSINGNLFVSNVDLALSKSKLLHNNHTISWVKVVPEILHLGK